MGLLTRLAALVRRRPLIAMTPADRCPKCEGSNITGDAMEDGDDANHITQCGGCDECGAEWVRTYVLTTTTTTTPAPCRNCGSVELDTVDPAGPYCGGCQTRPDDGLFVMALVAVVNLFGNTSGRAALDAGARTLDITTDYVDGCPASLFVHLQGEGEVCVLLDAAYPRWAPWRDDAQIGSWNAPTTAAEAVLLAVAIHEAVTEHCRAPGRAPGRTQPGKYDGHNCDGCGCFVPDGDECGGDDWLCPDCDAREEQKRRGVGTDDAPDGMTPGEAFGMIGQPVELTEIADRAQIEAPKGATGLIVEVVSHGAGKGVCRVLLDPEYATDFEGGILDIDFGDDEFDYQLTRDGLIPLRATDRVPTPMGFVWTTDGVQWTIAAPIKKWTMDAHAERRGRLQQAAAEFEAHAHAQASWGVAGLPRFTVSGASECAGGWMRVAIDPNNNWPLGACFGPWFAEWNGRWTS